MQIHWIDLTIIVAYLVGITGIGIYVGRWQSESSTGYFLAGRSLGWAPVGLALFATNISTVHLIGLASSGFSDGMVIGNFEWLAPFLLITLGLVFAPFYFRTKISTLPEFLEGRYGAWPRTMLAFMAVVGALFIHIGVTLYAGAVMVQNFVDIPITASILIVSLLTVIYTVFGGLKGVVVTESIQTVLLLAGSLAVTIFAVLTLGDTDIHNLEGLRQAARPGQLSMIHNEGEFAWYCMLVGYPVIGIWYWCSDQTIVQRVLGARSERDAQLGPIFCGFIKILPPLIMVLPGVLCYVLFKDMVGENADSALIVLIKELLPRGLQGVVIAGLLAALMSTVAGALNSTATLVSIDIVKRVRPTTKDRTLVRIGRLTAVVVMVCAMLWSTQGQRFGGIFKGINQMISVLAPPISVVFIWGIFWRRATSIGALATLVFGFVLGGIVFVLDFPAVSGCVLGLDSYGEPRQLFTNTMSMPFMFQAGILFGMCSIVLVVVSLLTRAPRSEQIERYCWKNPLAVITEKPISGVLDPRILSAVLVIIMAICYYIFA
ncbi:MAG: sodium:solute symporter [Sedimentisphaerales bacterium]|nr:sodium:solute symporter [Sedimentisphaerales bacterium]